MKTLIGDLTSETISLIFREFEKPKNKNAAEIIINLIKIIKVNVKKFRYN